jgi:hypothetical protein
MQRLMTGVAEYLNPPRRKIHVDQQTH